MKTLAALVFYTCLASAAFAVDPVQTKDDRTPIIIRETSGSSDPVGSLFSLGGGGGVVAAAVLAGVLFSLANSSGSHGSNVGP